MQVSLGDLPHGSVGYQSIFAAGLVLMLMTLVFNVDRLLPDPQVPGGVLMAAAAEIDLDEIRAAASRWRKQPRHGLRRRSACCILLACLGLLALLFLDLVHDGAARFGWDFFTNFPSRKAERAGILSAWVGTSLIMLVTALVALPVGVAAAIYLEEYAPKNWFTSIIEINVTNLAGVPSIVYGLLALGLFVYTVRLRPEHPVGGLTLALLILPIIIVATREALRAVPKAIREAAYGLGATRWEVTKDHVLPYSTGGILTGLILGLSRAIGETAPIITIGALSFIAFLPPSPVTGEFPFLNFEWLKSRFTAMPIQMFNWVSRPDQAFQANAAAAGAILLGMTLLMNAVAIVDPLPLPQEDQVVTDDARHECHIETATTMQVTSIRRVAVASRWMSARRPRRTRQGGGREARFLVRRRISALKNINLPIPEQPGDGADRPVGLRQEHVPALLQPHARPVAGHALRGRDHAASRTTSNILGPGVDPIEVRMRIGMVFQKPNPFPKSIFENVAYGLRLRGVSNRAELAERVEKALRGAALWDEVKDRLQRLGARAVGRPAAAAVHRAGAGDRAGDPAVRRADLGARPDRDREDRGADHRAARPRDDPDRHAQHAAGGARVGLHGVHVPGRAGRGRRDVEDLHQPAQEGDRRLHHGPLRLRHRSAASPDPVRPHLDERSSSRSPACGCMRVEMGGLVIDQVASCGQGAARRATPSSREIVLSREARVNEYDRLLDRDSLTYIALQQPVASDLRLARGIARIGRRAGTRRATRRRRSRASPLQCLATGETRPGDRRGALPAAHGGAVRRHAAQRRARRRRIRSGALAREVLRARQELDAEFAAALRQLMSFVMQDHRFLQASIDTMFALKGLERIGDHAKNVAEQVIYIVEGDLGAN